jgi:hypothetical protein
MLADAMLADLEAPADLLREVPTPGYFYRIRKGDTLLGLAGRAYQVSAGTQARLDLARRINRHPLNRKYLRTQSASSLFPEGLVSFFPHYACDPNALMWSAGPPPRGSCFAVLYVPLRASPAFGELGRAVDVPTAYLASRLRLVRERNAVLAAEPTLDDILEVNLPPGLAIVPEPRNVPFRFICALVTAAPVPGTPHVTQLIGPSTGTLTGHRHILTAAHVLFDDNGDRVKLVLVTPAADSAYKHDGLPATINGADPTEMLLHQASPFGLFEARKAMFDPRYLSGPHSHLYDYAVLRTTQPIGSRPWVQGQYGYWNSDRWGEGTILVPQKPREYVQGKRVYVSGYPLVRAKAYGPAQAVGAGPVENDMLGDLRDHRAEGRERIGYDIPTVSGHSGAPVWRTVRSQGRVLRSLTAVHSRHLGVGSGVLLTRTVYDQVIGWTRGP